MSSVFCKKDLEQEVRGCVAEQRWDKIPSKENERVLKIVINCTSDEEFANNVSSDCTGDTFSAIFLTLVERGHWMSIGKCLDSANVILTEEQRKHFLGECVKRANDFQFRDFIVDALTHVEQKSVLVELVEKSYWKSVDGVLDCVSDLPVGAWDIVFEKACRNTRKDTLSSLFRCCPKSKIEQALKIATDRGMWHAVSDLCRKPIDKRIEEWALKIASLQARVEDLAYFDVSQLARIFVHTPSEDRRDDQESRNLRILKIKYQETNKVEYFTGDVAALYVHILLNTPEDLTSKVFIILEEIMGYLTTLHFASLQTEMQTSLRRRNFESYVNTFYRHVREEILKHSRVASFSEHVAKAGMLHFLKFGKPGQGLTLNVLVPLLAFQKVNKFLEREAFAKLPLVKEEVRRVLFRAAVEHQEWEVVQQFADHTLYRDQRSWALKESVKKREWETALLLGDYGVPYDQLSYLHLLIARHCTFKTIPKLLKRGLYLEDHFCFLRQEIESLHYHEKKKVENLMRLKRRMDSDIRKKDFETCVHKKRWVPMLHMMRRNPKDSIIDLAVNKAIESQATLELIQFVRYAMGQQYRKKLFPVAMDKKVWAVVSELIEHDVIQQLCQEDLQTLINEEQYVLIARVIELGLLNNSQKEDIIEQGFRWEEGSVVVNGINVLDTPLPADQRKEMYRRAETLGMWQVVKRLVEEKDKTGTAQCNLALQSAVENHLWDVAEHCIIHGALIDQRKTDGHTLLQKAALIKDWKAVRKLVEYGADQSLPDQIANMTVLQRAVHEATKTILNTDSDIASTNQASSLTEIEYHKSDTEPIEILHTLVQFHGDLTAAEDKERSSPLDKLLQMVDKLSQDTLMSTVTDRCGDIVEETLFWGKDVCKSKDFDGRTALHLLCQAGRFESLYFFVARGCDPLAVTRFGETVLLCAARHPTNSLKLVAECIKLGLNHVQPIVSDAWQNLGLSQHVQPEVMTLSEFKKKETNPCVTLSPFEMSVIQSNLEMMFMLYESGACSNKELVLLHERYNGLHNADNVSREPFDLGQSGIKRRKLSPSPQALCSESSDLCQTADVIKSDALVYLKQIATSPRSLTSHCGLLISKCLGINHRRLMKVNMLRLSESAKRFVVFADLTSVPSTRDAKLPHYRTLETDANQALVHFLSRRETVHSPKKLSNLRHKY